MRIPIIQLLQPSLEDDFLIQIVNTRHRMMRLQLGADDDEGTQ